MNWFKYASWIKRLAIIPLIVGILSIVEGLLPLKVLETVVVAKNDSYRLKTDSYTYTIDFVGIDDQFTKEIYDYIQVGDSVILEMTYFNEQIVTLHQKGVDFVYQNDTGETYAVYGFAIAFILAGLLFFKKGVPKNWQLKYTAILIIFSMISAFRMLF